MPPTANPSSFLVRLLEWAGFALLCAIALTPVVLIPAKAQIALDFTTDRSADIMVKLVFLQTLAAAAIATGAGLLLTRRWVVYAGRVLLPVAALGAFLLWGTLSVFASGTPWHCLYYWLPMLLAAGAALTGPFFLTNPRHVRLFLFLTLGVGIVVSLIGVISSLGVYGLNRWMYGFDPREIAELDAPARAQGGAMRGAALSTLANPEYAGSYAAAIAAIASIFLFDWIPAARRRWLWRVLMLGAVMLLLMQLTFTGTRQPWIALGLAGLLRLLVALGTPVRWLAGGFVALVMSVFFFGFSVAFLVLAGALVAVAAHGVMSGGAAALWRRADGFNRWLVVGAPAAGMVLLVAFSTPGWWNPTGLRILQRFASITNPRDESVTERNLMFMAASQTVWEKPVFGTGPGKYNNRLAESFHQLVRSDETGVMFLARNRFGSQIADQTHNDYLQIASETGLPGLVLFLTAILAILQGLWRIVHGEAGERRHLALAVLFCLIAFLGVMFTSFPLQMPSRAAVFWTMVACALGLIAGGDNAEENAP